MARTEQKKLSIKRRYGKSEEMSNKMNGIRKCRDHKLKGIEEGITFGHRLKDEVFADVPHRSVVLLVSIIVLFDQD
jgi:hypothetical protein